MATFRPTLASPSILLLSAACFLLGTGPAIARPVLDLARTATAFKLDENGEQLSMDLTDTTRLTAPCKSVPNRWCVEDIPSERLSCPAVLLDLREAVGRNSSMSIGRDLLEEVLAKATKGLKIKDTQGRVLLLITGYKESWENKDDTATSDGTGKATVGEGSTGPVLSVEAAMWLADNYTALPIVGLGTDANILGTSEAMMPLAEKNLYVLESLRNLESLMPVVGSRTAGNSLLIALPVKLAKASVAPARVLVVPAPPPEVDSRANAGAEQHMAILFFSLLASAVRLGKDVFCL